MLRRLCVFFQLDICDRFVFGIAAFVLRGSVEEKTTVGVFCQSILHSMDGVVVSFCSLQ